MMINCYQLTNLFFLYGQEKVKDWLHIESHQSAALSALVWMPIGGAQCHTTTAPSLHGIHRQIEGNRDSTHSYNHSSQVNPCVVCHRNHPFAKAIINPTNQLNCPLTMSPPSYADLGKQARNIFSQNYRKYDKKVPFVYWSIYFIFLSDRCWFGEAWCKDQDPK